MTSAAMKSVTVTYHAPPGDSKVVEAFGHTFYDGKSEQVEVPEHVANKMRGNKHFQCSEPQDAKPKAQDAKATKAEEDAAKRADAEKTAAQLPNPPQRGAILNKEEAAEPPSFPEGSDPQHKSEAQHHDKQGEAHKAKT